MKYSKIKYPCNVCGNCVIKDHPYRQAKESKNGEIECVCSLERDLECTMLYKAVCADFKSPEKSFLLKNVIKKATFTDLEGIVNYIKDLNIYHTEIIGVYQEQIFVSYGIPVYNYILLYYGEEDEDNE